MPEYPIECGQCGQKIKLWDNAFKYYLCEPCEELKTTVPSVESPEDLRDQVIALLDQYQRDKTYSIKWRESRQYEVRDSDRKTLAEIIETLKALRLSRAT